MRHHYVRGDRGVYRFGWKRHKEVEAKRSLVKDRALSPGLDMEEVAAGAVVETDFCRPAPIATTELYSRVRLHLEGLVDEASPRNDRAGRIWLPNQLGSCGPRSFA